MSGTDSKAGGYDYLALFTQAKTVSKKVGRVAATAALRASKRPPRRDEGAPIALLTASPI